MKKHTNDCYTSNKEKCNGVLLKAMGLPVFVNMHDEALIETDHNIYSVFDPIMNPFHAMILLKWLVSETGGVPFSVGTDDVFIDNYSLERSIVSAAIDFIRREGDM